MVEIDAREGPRWLLFLSTLVLSNGSGVFAHGGAAALLIILVAQVGFDVMTDF